MTAISRDGKIISGKELTFIAEDEEHYPQLTRLFLDFDFRVFAIGEINQNDRFLVTYRNFHDHHAAAVTPAFSTLAALEAHCDKHIIKILRDTLFSDSDRS